MWTDRWFRESRFPMSTPGEIPRNGGPMHISGILVRTSPAEVRACVDRLVALEHVDVDRFDESSGRVVIVQESGTRAQQEEGLRRIQAVPGVASAELICHFVAGETDEAAAAAAGVPA